MVSVVGVCYPKVHVPTWFRGSRPGFRAYRVYRVYQGFLGFRASLTAKVVSYTGTFGTKVRTVWLHGHFGVSSSLRVHVPK